MGDYNGFGYRSAKGCPDADVRHTKTPAGYLAWHEWATRMRRTHRQERCPRCGYWAVWVPKTPDVKQSGERPAGGLHPQRQTDTIVTRPDTTRTED